MDSFLIMLTNRKMNYQRAKIFSFVSKTREEKFDSMNSERSFSRFYSAEEREETEILNNCRQKQLEMQHRQLLQELERLKSIRNASSNSSITKSLTNGIGPETSSTIDTNFKHVV